MGKRKRPKTKNRFCQDKKESSKEAVMYRTIMYLKVANLKSSRAKTCR